ncbi:hypothetical protein CBOM_03489 [Ceraceosorus bombacis]|uniref:Uncharacterized protein n=1 Tax=Ceraceosorus bombacis TaxID=401625 RepID=A0A0P1BNW5_9BASI|nr:hypothetical protein CBOM_03489 [Ceraceosorus bombacis]
MSALPPPPPALPLPLQLLSHLLSQTAYLNKTLSQPISSSFYPFTWLSTLHALRTSLAFRALAGWARARAGAGRSEDEGLGMQNGERRGEGQKRQRRRPGPGWMQDTVGFLIMAWGGSFAVAYLNNTVPTQLLFISAPLNYLSAHLVLQSLLCFAPAPNAALLDTCLFVLDGAMRAQAVSLGVTLPSLHANPLVRTSLPFHILCGVLAATAGSQVAGMLGIFHHTWTLDAPPFVRAQSLLQVVDIFAAFLAAMSYGCIAHSHPSYTALHAAWWSKFAFVYADQQANEDEVAQSGNVRASPWPSKAEQVEMAKAAATIIIAICFAVRAFMIHWLPAATTTMTTRTLRRRSSGRTMTGTGTGTGTGTAATTRKDIASSAAAWQDDAQLVASSHSEKASASASSSATSTRKRNKNKKMN